jgi:hypothetical protein
MAIYPIRGLITQLRECRGDNNGDIPITRRAYGVLCQSPFAFELSPTQNLGVEGYNESRFGGGPSMVNYYSEFTKHFREALRNINPPLSETSD